MDVFVSVGSRLNPDQETFVAAIEARLSREGLRPRTLQRNAWSTLAPLDAVSEIMATCCGAVILGLERYRFAEGIERRGSAAEKRLDGATLPTSWNQIEAALAYSRKLPLLVIVDESLMATGLLEPGHGWFIAQVKVDPASLNSEQFNGLLADWRAKVVSANATALAAPTPSLPGPGVELAKLRLKDLLGYLRLGEIWALVAVIGALVIGAFGAGMKLSPLLEKPRLPISAAPAKSAYSPLKP